MIDWLWQTYTIFMKLLEGPQERSQNLQRTHDQLGEEST